MAEFSEIMKIKKRMCEVAGYCGNCVNSATNNGKDIQCSIFLETFPEEAERKMLEWAKEHPVKTNADKFKEVFGYEVNSDCCDVFKDNNNLWCGTCVGCKFQDFWIREYKEPGK